MKLPCDSINVRNNISMSVDVVALVCVCIFSVYIFVIHLVLLAGCSRGTSGSEFKQRQKFFRTIWWESFLSLFCQGSVFSSNADRKVNLSVRQAGEDVVFVANDWHTALLPCYLKTMYQSRGLYKNAKVSFLLILYCLWHIFYYIVRTCSWVDKHDSR